MFAIKSTKSREPEKDVIDLLADEGPQSEEFAVDPMQDRLEEVAFARVLAVEQLEQLDDRTE